MVAKAAKMTADEKATADRRGIARAAVKAAEDAKAAAVSVAASQAHEKLRSCDRWWQGCSKVKLQSA